MGSPLGPLFANVFMSNFERKHRQALTELGVRTWLRYVDDIFVTLSDVADADRALEFLNKQHPNIRFTIEHESEGKLPFLDTCVYRGLNSYRTTIYRKKTFTGVYLNWTSLTTKKYKIGLIYCLMDRIWKICADPNDRDQEVSKLRAILAKNEYPEFVIEREIDKFIKNRNDRNERNEAETAVDKDDKPTRFIVLPYVSHKAENFEKRLKSHVNTFYPKVDFNDAFNESPNEVGKYFPYKDQVKNIQQRSLVIYGLKCLTEGCNASYIGKTARILCHRIKEHRTGSESACHQHEIDNPGHLIAYDNVEIIDRADSNFKLEIKELLHIVSKKPSLNKQLNSQSKFNIRTLIIAAYPHLVDEAVRS